jgi:hypothetical protein
LQPRLQRVGVDDGATSIEATRVNDNDHLTH